MKISIIIPIFNEEKYVKNVLDKINNLNIWKEQSYQSEIIVINDGSTDGSLKILEQNPEISEDQLNKLIKFTYYLIKNS